MSFVELRNGMYVEVLVMSSLAKNSPHLVATLVETSSVWSTTDESITRRRSYLDTQQWWETNGQRRNRLDDACSTTNIQGRTQEFSKGGAETSTKNHVYDKQCGSKRRSLKVSTNSLICFLRDICYQLLVYSMIHLFLLVFICFAVFLQDVTYLWFKHGLIERSFLYPTANVPSHLFVTCQRKWAHWEKQTRKNFFLWYFPIFCLPYLINCDKLKRVVLLLLIQLGLKFATLLILSILSQYLSLFHWKSSDLSTFLSRKNDEISCFWVLADCATSSIATSVVPLDREKISLSKYAIGPDSITKTRT